MRPDALLFGESASRVILTVAPEDAETMLTIARDLGAPAKKIGAVGGRLLVVNQLLAVDVAELKSKWLETYPKMFGN